MMALFSLTDLAGFCHNINPFERRVNCLISCGGVCGYIHSPNVPSVRKQQSLTVSGLKDETGFD